MATKIIKGISSIPKFSDVINATLGKFDGFHVGHQKILNQLTQLKNSNSGKTIVISFSPNPVEILNPGVNYPFITTLDQRLDLLSEYGVDYYCILEFSLEFSKMPAEDFLQNILIDKLNVQNLLIGNDAAVGYKKKGDASFIKNHFEEQNRSVKILSFDKHNDSKVSSGWLRSAIDAGDLETFHKLTNRNYVMQSVVAHGDKRGRELGFPTANLEDNNQKMPAAGIYATKVTINGVTHNSVTSVGVRPTFKGKNKVVEVHILDYPFQEIYGETIDVEFIRFLRAELKYNSVEDLCRQIEVDISNSRSALKQ